MKYQFSFKKAALLMSLCLTMVLCVGCGDKKEESSSQEETALNKTGSITDLSENGFSIEDADGNAIDFITDENTVDATSEGGMAKGDYVCVIYMKQGDDNLATDVSYAERTAQGTVDEVKDDSFTMAVADSSEVLTFSYDADTNFNLDGQSVLSGDKVIVTYKTDVAGNYVTAVNAQVEDTEEESTEDTLE